MDSYPPHLLRLPGSEPGSPARGARAPEPSPEPVEQVRSGGHRQMLVATVGRPGAYVPPVSPGNRPRNITELEERVQPATLSPWPTGAFLPIGERGKRAHWTGAGWKGGESPGYRAGAIPVRSATEQTGTEQ